MITLDAVCSLFHGPLGVSCLDVHPGYCFWLWTHNSCFVQQLGLSLYPIHWVPSYRPLVASEKPCGEWHWRCDGSWCIVLKIFEVSIFWHQKHKMGYGLRNATANLPAYSNIISDIHNKKCLAISWIRCYLSGPAWKKMHLVTGFWCVIILTLHIWLATGHAWNTGMGMQPAKND